MAKTLDQWIVTTIYKTFTRHFSWTCDIPKDLVAQALEPWLSRCQVAAVLSEAGDDVRAKAVRTSGDSDFSWFHLGISMVFLRDFTPETMEPPFENLELDAQKTWKCSRISQKLG